MRCIASPGATSVSRQGTGYLEKLFGAVMALARRRIAAIMANAIMTNGHLYKLENWANKHLEVSDFMGVGLLTPELIEMPQ